MGLRRNRLRAREDVWRDADWQVQALGQGKLALQSNRQYYAGLIANGLNANENGYVSNIDAGITAATLGPPRRPGSRPGCGYRIDTS